MPLPHVVVRAQGQAASRKITRPEGFEVRWVLYVVVYLSWIAGTEIGRPNFKEQRATNEHRVYLTKTEIVLISLVPVCFIPFLGIDLKERLIWTAICVIDT